MKEKKRKADKQTWLFRELAMDMTCSFFVSLYNDEDGRMLGTLTVKIQEKTWNFHYQHPVNMNLPGSLFLVLDKNVFTEACIHLDIDETGLQIKGDIYVDDEIGRIRLNQRRKIWATEQTLSGELLVNGRLVTFDGGKGYLEENREPTGKADTEQFWSQCNWFEDKPLRLTCGGRGRSCYAWIDRDGYHVRMAGWKGAKVEYMDKQGFRMCQGRYVLEGWCAEGGADTVRYRLSHDGDVLFDEISRRAAYVLQ